MFAITMGQLIFFRRRGWLGSPKGIPKAKGFEK
jgi:hypothetical protein